MARTSLVKGSHLSIVRIVGGKGGGKEVKRGGCKALPEVRKTEEEGLPAHFQKKLWGKGRNGGEA